MDLATLKAFEPAEYEEAADGFQTVSDTASAAKDTVENGVRAGIRNTLEGKAADAALRELKELGKNFHYVQTECALVSTALNAFALDMATAKRKLTAALTDAEAAGCTVSADGSVSFPAGGKEVDGKVPEGGTVAVGTGIKDPTASALERQAVSLHPNPNFGKAVEFADRIGDALKEATDADAKWAPKLGVLKADDDLVVSDRDWTDVSDDTREVAKGADAYVRSLPKPPRSGDPAEVAEWWSGLSDEQRSAYLSLRPDSIGAMDGLPATVRDEADRVVLAESRGAYQDKLDAWTKKEPEHYRPYISPITGLEVKGAFVETDEWKEWDKKRQDLQGRIHGMDLIQDRFDRTGTDGLPEAYLIGFSPEGKGHDGKVILANGNPDTADHTGIYVPGTGTLLKDIGGDLGRGETLWHESDRYAQGQKVATITWFDYDAPLQAMPFEKGGGLFPEAMFDRYAEKGGPGLSHYLDGNLEARRSVSGNGDLGHITLTGHSYGTTLIGDAAKSRIWPEGALPVDDVIAVGSPGMQAEHAADLGIPQGHMWAEKGGGNDAGVRIGGKYVAGLGDDWTIPTDPEFGANIMESDAEDHGAFWDEGSTSLRNQALVIAGQYDKVTLE
ncbi:alpha/beta hydrolase family protein [Streptomyces murinus]|uniref:alpha/beta hydrolase n=1 Tax=Streptomyces murinus TaxID=33900 RepID=UPI000A1F50B9|nr:alpha/beta hydrolase [Streptomyces murinus]WDO06571.1 alpha/beta hydrolase family protein [Streptomyces murinus]